MYRYDAYLTKYKKKQCNVTSFVGLIIRVLSIIPDMFNQEINFKAI
jgi:hypothetical protein